MGFLDGAFCVVFNITWSFLEALGFGLRELFMISFSPPYYFLSALVSWFLFIVYLSLEFSLFLM